MTRADKYRSLGDEGLARLCVENAEAQGFCRYLKKCGDMLDSDELIPAEWCVECALLWLQEEIDDGNDEDAENW